MSIDVIGMACHDSGCDFKPHNFKRRAVGDNDVLFDLEYCGVCHSDLHTAANHFSEFGMNTKYPCVVGHELAGVCVQVGKSVTKFKVGDHIGVGCLVDSCLECDKCLSGQEQYCTKGAPECPLGVQTYQSPDKFGRAAVYPEGSVTMGGYADKMVIHERFGILIPKDYPLECAGPVMCSGITLYEPLMVHGATAASRVGIVGMGGLGLMGVKLAKELGCIVTAISRGPSKKALAMKSGAQCFLDSKSEDEMREQMDSFDLIINTIPVHHDITPYWRLLKRGRGKLVVVGLNPTFLAASVFGAIGRLAGVYPSVIGGIANTQKVVDLCARAKIVPETKLVPVQQLNQVFTMLDKANDTGLRYVLDIKNSLNESAFETCTSPAPDIGPAAEMNPSSMLREAGKLCRLAVSRNKLAVAVTVTLVAAGIVAVVKHFKKEK